MLDYFARHAGRVFTRDQLLDSVWRDTAFVTPRSVDVYVRRIREKIDLLNDVTHHLAENMMNTAVSSALKGTKI